MNIQDTYSSLRRAFFCFLGLHARDKKFIVSYKLTYRSKCKYCSCNMIKNHEGHWLKVKSIRK